MTQSVTASPKLYIGIDIHKKSWKVHFCTDLFDGATKSFVSDPEAFKNYVHKHYPTHQVTCAYEAGCCGYSAARAFLSFEWQVLVVNPADIPRPGKQRLVKTDKIDCINIAKQLKNEALHSIRIPDVQQEQLRCLFRRRFDLVKDFRKIKSRLKSFLLYHGIHVPLVFDNPNWSHAFIDWMVALEWEHITARFALDSMISFYRFVDEQLRDVSKKIRAYCRKHFKENYYLMRSIPGIGPLTAAAFISEAGDLRRFHSFKQFASFIGMVPGIYQSGDSLKTMGMTPRSNQILRSYVIEAAWIACRKDPVMQQYYRKHLGKNAKAIIVKVARKLLSRLLAVIKTQIPYQIGVLN
jgi:transposase